MDDLKKENGTKTLIRFMYAIFKMGKLTQVYDGYIRFDRYKCSANGTIESSITEFQKLYVKNKKYNVGLLQGLLAFKLLNRTLLEHKDPQLVLTAVDYFKVETLFNQMKNALRRFFGEQSKPDLSTDDCAIKYETTLVT